MFSNASPTDFSHTANIQGFQAALDRFAAQVRPGPVRVGPIIGGKELWPGTPYVRYDPSDPAVALAQVYPAGEDLVDEAIDVLSGFAPIWADTVFKERARILREAGRLLLERREDLAAMIIREAGKPWKEADADVVEAIDFCNYYAEEMCRLGPARRTQTVAAEDNFYHYAARGVCAVISPWNFPLAITCGMASAALVSGNTVALKPSRQTSLIAYVFVKILLEAGMPAQAVAFLPGSGQLIGRRLVHSPKVHLYAFTGSREVGLEIMQNAAMPRPGQAHLKRVIAELGGKNAIIVDEDADLDEAVKGILYSAFGYAGQKCSACSRVIGVGSAYEALLTRLAPAAASLQVGPASDAGTYVPPVIDRESQQRILGIIAAGEKECAVAYKGEPKGGGFFVPPTIFRDVPADSPLWCEEIFGPVLSCRPAANFQEAIDQANHCDYALTGGVYSRSPAHIESAKRHFAVGNLYINRSCTGAIVERQPFGGFRMSGVGSKAGGPDYLLQFMEPRCYTENLLRRGFAPEQSEQSR